MPYSHLINSSKHEEGNQFLSYTIIMLHNYIWYCVGGGGGGMPHVF